MTTPGANGQTVRPARQSPPGRGGRGCRHRTVF